MKSILVILCLSILANLAFTQDLIVTKSGEKIEGKVTDVQNNQVKFHKKDNPDGPVYILNKDDIVMIKYKDGKTQVFIKEIVEPRVEKEEPTEQPELGQHLVTYHLFDIVFNDFTLSYEQIFKGGSMGLEIPIGIGFNYNEYYAYGDYSNKFYSGLGLNFYPTGQGQWRYFVGPSFRLGMARTQIYTPGTAPNWIGTEYVKEFFYAKLFVNNGIVYSPVPNLSISAIGSLGIKYFDINIDEYTQKGVYNSGHFAVNMSYRF